MKKAMTRLCVVVIGVTMFAGCGAPVVRAALPLDVSRRAPPPVVPTVSNEDREPWQRCAAGGIKRALLKADVLRGPRAMVGIVANSTRDTSLQTDIKLEALHAVNELGLEAYTDDQAILLVKPNLRVRTEVTVYDRTIKAGEAEQEFGVNFGRGNGAGTINNPSAEKISHGSVRAITIIESVVDVQGGVPILAVRASHASRAEIFTKTSTKGTQFFLLVNFGKSQVLKEVAGPQRALLSSARASIAGALLKAVNEEPAVCGL
jgi:hypothetical protein